MKKLIALLSICFVAGLTSQALATLVNPTFYPGNPDCETLGACDYDTVQFKFDNDPDGNAPLADYFNPSFISVDFAPISFPNEISVPEPLIFDWWSADDYAVMAVIVKGGNREPGEPGANVWCYGPLGSYGGTGLYAPEPHAISHVTFCYTRSVPEPASFLLFGTGLIGLAGLAGISRRKSQK